MISKTIFMKFHFQFHLIIFFILQCLPTYNTHLPPEQKSPDIVLCLHVSKTDHRADCAMRE